MGINIADNFQYLSQKPLDGRTKYDTTAAMKAVPDSSMYDGCLAYCSGTDKTYQWKSTNPIDATLGRWREFETGGEDAKAYHTDDSAETSIVDADSFPFYDASASTPKRSLWSNVKSVLKTYFDSLYQKTLTAGTNITISNDTISASMPVMGTFSKGDLYDTTEKVIGKWTDGRPLYQRTYSGTIPSSDGTQALFSLPSSYCRVMYAEGCAFWDGTNYVSIPFSTESGSKADHAGLYTYNNTMYIDMTDTNSYFRGKSYYVTIRYIKTTDSTNSYNYASENDYSNNEHVIGTWTTGATLYQKTFAIIVPTTSTAGVEVNAEYPYSDFNLPTSISRIVEIQGIVELNDNTYRALNQANYKPSGNGELLYVCLAMLNGYGVKKVRIMNSMPVASGQYAYVTIKYTY